MNRKTPDVALNIAETHRWLRDHGFKITLKGLGMVATRGAMPFFKGPDGRTQYIWLSALEERLHVKEALSEVA